MYIKLRDWKIENENLGLNANVVVPNDITDILNKNNKGSEYSEPLRFERYKQFNRL